MDFIEPLDTAGRTIDPAGFRVAGPTFEKDPLAGSRRPEPG
jgi:hypothetical protein